MPATASPAARRAVLAGQQRDLDAGRGGERGDRGVMLAREQFGRRHQRGLAASLHDVRHGDQRDDRLAGADIALQQPQHALLAGKVALDLGERLTLRAGQREGQGGLDLLPQRAFRPPSGAAAALEAAAHQQQRELAREKLVEGEPLPCRPRRAGALDRRGLMDFRKRGGEGGPSRAREEVGRKPFRQLRQRAPALRPPRAAEFSATAPPSAGRPARCAGISPARSGGST